VCEADRYQNVCFDADFRQRVTTALRLAALQGRITVLQIARQQQAKSWELRAAMSMARLWGNQGKRQQARELVAPVYGGGLSWTFERQQETHRMLTDDFAVAVEDSALGGKKEKFLVPDENGAIAPFSEIAPVYPATSAVVA
jgi:hypothetical protein